VRGEELELRGLLDALGDLELVSVQLERRLERREQVVRNGRGRHARIAVEDAQQQHELVAAVAREHVAGARARGQARGDLAQQRVSRVVPERVVDDLEVSRSM
jgi:hypothetical protein